MSDIQECFHVEFVNEPDTTVVGATITDDLYSRGDPLEVGVFDQNNARVSDCGIAAAGSTVTITKDQAAGALTGNSESFACGPNGLAATFDDLSIGGLAQSALPKTYTLTASGLGTQDTSGQFDIIYGVPCTTSGCPSFTTSLGSSQVTSSATGSSFTFLAVVPSSIPTKITSAGGGCAFYKPVGGAFEAIDGRSTSTGELRFTYYLNKTDIAKLYGSNQGQQFVPLCAGAAWVDGNGDVKRCDADGAPLPWVGKGLSPDPVTGVPGRFDGSLKRAVCDGGQDGTGLFWGILGSFQDYNHPANGLVIDPAMSPTVTGWDSTGNFRFFNVRVPAPWDWKMG